MIINDKGRDIIKTHEGCKLEAYQDAVGIWTIGYGCTLGITPGLKITQEEADDLLEITLEVTEKHLNTLCPPNANQNQFSACVSLAYNIGVGAFEKSTLLRKWRAGDVKGAAEEFPKWIKAGGKVLPGLVKRRAAERKLFEELPS